MELLVNFMDKHAEGLAILFLISCLTLTSAIKAWRER